MISFKGAQYPKDVILFAVFFYVRYGVSYRDLEEIMAERGVSVDHTTLNRWVTRYSGAIAEAARRRKGPCDRSWRMDETYIKVKGAWVYLYRAVDKHGKTLDFMLSQRRNKPAATRFFARMLETNGLPRKIVIDKSGANTAGIKAINKMLKGFGCPIPIEMVRRKYLNNIVEQDHRFIKRRTRPMLGFKALASAAATLDGIEVAHMIRKGQLTPGLCPFRQLPSSPPNSQAIAEIALRFLNSATEPFGLVVTQANKRPKGDIHKLARMLRSARFADIRCDCESGRQKNCHNEHKASAQ